jgi:hypothetical protein
MRILLRNVIFLNYMFKGMGEAEGLCVPYSLKKILTTNLLPPRFSKKIYPSPQPLKIFLNTYSSC